MEYVIFFATFGLFVVAVMIKGAWDTKRELKYFILRLRQNYGEIPQKEYKLERFLRIGSYYLKHPKEGQVDDITWNDLNMDEIFKRMNHTNSSTGEEYLYYLLRSPSQSREELEHLEALISYFEEHEEERIKIQVLMHKLGGTGNYSLYDYLDYLDSLGKRSNQKHILLNVAFLLFGLVCFFKVSLGVIGIAMLIVYNITTYFREKKEIEPYIVSFAYIIRLIDISEQLIKIPVPVCKQEWERIQTNKTKMNRMRKGAFWVLSGVAVTASGNPLDIFMDYVRMAFHVDLIKFNKMLSELNQHLGSVDELVEQIGLVESAISIGEFRASLEHGWCRPEFVSRKELNLKECYHPLLSAPIKNSIDTSRGVLLTGSNASGKSTFLKTVALNAILAQTIHTCTAERYLAPFYRIYSSMSLKDDMENGESYYIVEIRSLKRILDAAKEYSGSVLCFVDEVLRGTNTVERIAASTQILKSLAGSNLLCFAATHDIELTHLLQKEYNNFHFEEDIREGDVFFNYKLQNGRATTRNAIRLLEIMGYDERIIEKAQRQAEKFVKEGVWELT